MRVHEQRTRTSLASKGRTPQGGASIHDGKVTVESRLGGRRTRASTDWARAVLREGQHPHGLPFDIVNTCSDMREVF